MIAVAPWLHISIGLGGALPLSLTYVVSETIVSPDRLVFETGGVSRNQQSGTSPSGQTALYVPVSIAGPAVRVGQELSIQPYVSMQHMLTSINTAADWGATTFRAGIRLALQREVIRRDTQRIEKPVWIRRDTMPYPQPKQNRQKITLSAGVRDAVTKQYLEQVDFSFNVKRRRLAVLPSIFFDSSMAAIPERFLQRKVLDVTKSANDIRDIDVSHSILHVLGKTMQRQPSAVVVVTGCHAEDGQIDERMRLARRRAESVRSYLVDEYGIDSSRIRLLVRAFPERASSVFTPFGRAENRRVDFDLREGKYDLPIQPDTLVVAAPVRIDARVETSRPETVQKIKVSLLADGIELASIDTNVTRMPLESPFAMTDALKQKLLQSKVVEVSVQIQDSVDGIIAERVRAFDVVAKPDEEQPFDEFGIVLFDYNSSQIADSELGVVAELKQRVSRADRITITGTSDESGIETENLSLARERAQSVARALGLKPGTYELRSQIATDYSSYIPEGRMLGRQVKVVLQTGNK